MTASKRTADPRWLEVFEQQGDLASVVSQWKVGQAVPEGIADTLRTARGLIVDSYYNYDYTLVAAAWSWMIAEACLRACIPVADGAKDRRTFGPLVKQAVRDRLVTEQEAVALSEVVELRNRVFHRAFLKPKPAPESYTPRDALQMLEAVHGCVSDIYARASRERACPSR